MMFPMRIIAGTHRGRRLLGPADDATTRPITDRVKESLFSRLRSLGFFSEEGAGSVVDLFSGTGSLGLEALSRGARHGTFVDRDHDAIDRLEKNIETLEMADRVTVKVTDVFSPIWIHGLAADPPALVFLDPPYAMLEDQAMCEQLEDLMTRLAPAVHPEAGLVLRGPEYAHPLIAPGWSAPTSHPYGSMILHLYDRASD